MDKNLKKLQVLEREVKEMRTRDDSYETFLQIHYTYREIGKLRDILYG